MSREAENVDAYIENAPRELRPKLREVRDTIREVAPDSVETISYGMPFYSFKGESGFKARLCYFGLMKNNKKIAFYSRPVYLEEHRDETQQYLTTKSALQFPSEGPIPLHLIKKVVRTGIRRHKAGT